MLNLMMMVKRLKYVLTMINFFFEDVDTFKFPRIIFKKHIKDLILKESKTTGDLNFIYCSDYYLLNINKTHLNHDYYTDIITFDFSVQPVLSGDLFISIDRIKENAIINKVNFINEFYRVNFHGVLHLCGYMDKTNSEKRTMTKKENYYLNLFNL
jgi:probable rRNA maturation factor